MLPGSRKSLNDLRKLIVDVVSQFQIFQIFTMHFKKKICISAGKMLQNLY